MTNKEYRNGGKPRVGDRVSYGGPDIGVVVEEADEQDELNVFFPGAAECQGAFPERLYLVGKVHYSMVIPMKFPMDHPPLCERMIPQTQASKDELYEAGIVREGLDS